MRETVIRTASVRRSEIAARAAAMRVDEAFVSTLVDEFYAAVREDAELGPVFASAIGEDWAPHLQTMKRFWASVALDAGTYDGRPVPAHHKHLDKIRPEHFQRWLALFASTLKRHAPTPEAAAFFQDRAERMGASFQAILFR